jgi:hypothetical protein
MTYLRYLCLFGSSLPPVVLRRVHDLLSIVVLPVYVSCPQTLPLNNDVRVIIIHNVYRAIHGTGNPV